MSDMQAQNGPELVNNHKCQFTARRQKPMRKFAAAWVIIVALGLLVFTTCSQPPQTNGDEIVAGDMLNSVMDYIKANHPDTAAFIPQDIKWTETVPDKKPGYTGVTYSAGGWTVTIGHAVTPEIIYDVRAEYPSGKIVWVGTIKDSLITELSYTAD
jgi:hypothetical protein